MMKKVIVLLSLLTLSKHAYAWEAVVTNILQHGERAAIYLSPDPGVGNCEAGSPYILIVDDTPASQQRFSMLLAALTTGKTIRGFVDECSTSIWGVSRPTIRRLSLRAD